MAEPLAYAINADAEGPVDRKLVQAMSQMRGVQYLLYAADRQHSNFLKTLRAIEAAVKARLAGAK